MSVLIAGCKGSGKTYYGLHKWAAEEIARTGNPLLCIDPQRVETLRQVYHARTIKETIERVWGHGLHTAYSPESDEEFDKLMAAVRAGENVVVLVDEVRFYMSSRTVSMPLTLLARVERNVKVSLCMTTQSFGDLSREVTCVADEFIFFRCVGPSDLERIEKQFGPDLAGRVAVLPQWVPERVKVGF